jgi:hypothetical protein
MSLRLEAICAPEGTAIVRDGETLRLLRPPYTRLSSPVLPEESIHDAILRHGFTSAHEEFATWEQVIDFLNQQVVEARRELGKDIPDTVPGGIIDVAPEEVVLDFLDRIERDLIPQGKLDHADNLLFAVLTSRILMNCPNLGMRAADLLRRSRAARDRIDEGIGELSRRDLRFQSLERHGQLERSKMVSEGIRRRGNVFAACA